MLKNATAVGSIAVVIWACGLTLLRLVTEEFGLFKTLGVVFLVTGLLSLTFFVRRGGLPRRAVFRQPALYARWGAFVTHECALLIALTLVSRENVPMVILLNYLWPTCIILCSVWFAGVQVVRRWAVAVGSLIVVGSMVIEVLGSEGIFRLASGGSDDLIAYGFAFVGALGWGFYSALSRRFGDITGGSGVIPFFQLSLVGFLPLSFLPEFAPQAAPTVLGYMLMGLYCGLKFVAYLSWDFGMRGGNIVLLSLFADFIPWLSLAIAAALLQVEISWTTVVTAVTLVVGAILSRYGTALGVAGRT